MSSSSSPKWPFWNWFLLKLNKQLDMPSLTWDLLPTRVERPQWRKSLTWRATSFQGARFISTSTFSFWTSYQSKSPEFPLLNLTPLLAPWALSEALWSVVASLAPSFLMPKRWSLIQMPVPMKSERNSWSVRSASYKRRGSSSTRNLRESLSKKISARLIR